MYISIKFPSQKFYPMIVMFYMLCICVDQKEDQNFVFKTDYCLMQVKSIAECSKGSILQYYLSSLSYYLPFRALFCLFLSGCLRQVLLYLTVFTV